jgi:tetratricopeptide (TPR) repeat protein
MARPGKFWWRAGVVLLLVGGAGLLAWPHLRAWYHYRAGVSAVERYHAEAALQHFEACLAVWPEDSQARLLASRAARLAGKFKEAEQHLREAQRLREQQGPSSEIALEWAMLHAAGGDLLDVEEFLSSQLTRSPRPDLIREALTEGYLRDYRLLDARSQLTAWLQLQPDNPQANFLFGEVWRNAGVPQKAIPCYRRAVELDPERVEARRWLGMTLLLTGYYADARDQLEAAHRALPGDPNIRVGLARCYAALDQNAEANALLDAVLEEDPEFGPALTQRGRMLYAAEKYADAEVWLRRAIGVNPSDSNANWLLAECLRLQNKTDQMRQQQVRVSELTKIQTRMEEIMSREMSARPNDAQLHCELGKLILQQGNKELAERWLLSALQRKPHLKEAHRLLAQLYKEQGNQEKADQHRREAEASTAEDGDDKKPASGTSGNTPRK